jgi:hypothetical protein
METEVAPDVPPAAYAVKDVVDSLPITIDQPYVEA